MSSSSSREEGAAISVRSGENGIERLFRVWPEVIAIAYQGQPEAVRANSQPHSAAEFYRETFGDYDLGAPNAPDHVALACIVEAARHLCAMDHAGALRLLRAAAADIESRPMGDPTRGDLVPPVLDTGE